jgi:hypothetical protein
MFDLETPLLRTTHGASYKDEACSRLFLRFDEAWMALTAQQLKGVGDTLGSILNCPFKAHHLASGMLLRSERGEYRMPLTEAMAIELHGLINDTILLLEAESAVSATTDSKTLEGSCNPDYFDM